MKRILLFILTNIAVMAVITVVVSALGLNKFIGSNGLQLGALMGFSLVVGFAGAIISLLISKPMAKFSTGAQVIQNPSSSTEFWLVDTVGRFAQKAGIAMPEVAIYNGEPNAFATGAFKNSALVAVSTGLLESMTREEVEAVLGHEVAHIANGDMVTMTLIQGVVNTFVVFFAHVVAFFVDKMLSNKDENESSSQPGIGYTITVMVCQIAFGFLASMIVAWFSRQREFRADAGAAQLMGSERPMINALARLGGMEPGALPQSIAAAGISDKSSFMELFSSHPPIEQRIAALQGRR